MDDFFGYVLMIAVVGLMGLLMYNGMINDHPVERFYFSGQRVTECGTSIEITAAQPWGMDTIVYKAKTFEEAVEKVKVLNSTLVKE